MANSVNIKVGFSVDNNGINRIKNEINSVKSSIGEMSKNNGLSQELDKAGQSAQVLDKALDKAYNKDLGRLNLKTLDKELKKQGTTLEGIERDFGRVGIKGTDAFRDIEREVLKTGYTLKNSSKMIDDMFNTLKNTAKWTLASGAVNSIQGGIQKALGFTKSLDESLNNIRVVSGQSSEEMERFAKEANTAAAALGKTTTEYTDASLIFFQQGKAADEVRQLTEATLMGANVTGTEVSQMADLLTAVMNGYNLEASKALEITDKLAAVGAATGADFEELATGMSRVASMAQVVGVEVDSLNAQIATISTVTREAPESIGNALKTVYARMAQIKVEGSATDEDGITYTTGKAEQALNSIGVTILESTGQMRAMEDVLADVGSQWEALDQIQKSAVTEALAGQRQANKLISLFNNWDMYQDALNTSLGAAGATMEQNEIRMDSLSYKTQQMRAELESLYMNLLDADTLKDGTDLLRGVLEEINSFVEMLGGGKEVVMLFGAALTSVFSKQLSASIAGINKNIRASLSNMQHTKDLKNLSNKGLERIDAAGKPESKIDAAKQDAERKRLELSKEEYKYRALLSDEEKEILTTKKGQIDQARMLSIEAMKNEQKSRDLAKELKITDKERLDIAIKSNEMSAADTAEYALLAQKVKEVTESLDEQEDSYEKMEEYLANQAKQLGFSERTIESMATEIETMFMQSQAEGEDFLGINEELDKIIDEQNEALKEQATLRTQLNQIAESQVLTEGENGENLQSNIQEAAANQLEGEAEQLFAGRGMERVMGLATKWGGTLLTSAMVAIPAMKTMFDETATEAEKVDAGFNAATAAASSFGFAVGGPVGAAVGALTVQIGKFIYENTGLRKVFNDNAKAIERFQKNTSDLKDDISDLTTAQGKLNEVQAMADAGITNENREEFVALQNEIAQLAPDIVKYYNDEGNAVIDLTADIKSLTEAKREQLKVENQRMVNMGGSLGVEYGKLASEGDARLDTINAQILETQDALNRAVSSEEIERLQTRLGNLQESLGETLDGLTNLRTNVQSNMIQPFFESEESVSRLQDGLKDFVSNLYDVDVAIAASEAGYKLYEMTGDIGSVKSSLDKSQQPAKNVAEALYSIQYDANNGNESAKKMLTSLEKMQPAAKTLATTLATSFDLDVTGIQNLIQDLAKATNDAGYIDTEKLNLSLEKISEIKTAQYDRELEQLEKLKKANEEDIDNIYNKMSAYDIARQGIERYTQAKIDEQRAFQAEGDNRTLFGRSRDKVIADEERALPGYLEEIDQLEKNQGSVDMSGAASIDISKAYHEEQARMQEESIQRQGELEGQIIEKKQEKEEYLQREAEYQDQINRAMDDYLFNLVDSTEGYNLVLEKYEELTGVQQSFFDALDSQIDDGGFFFGFEEELDNIQDKLGEGAENIGKAGDEYKEQFLNAFKSLPDGVKSQFEQVAGAAEGEIDKLVASAEAGSKESAKKLSDIAKAQAQETGKIYAALNKNNTAYFADFKKANKDQLVTVANTTGVMAEEYSTLADYKAALDRWQVENKDILNSEEASSTYFWAMEALGAVRDIDQNGIISATEAGIARANASKAASYAQVVAQADAELDKNKSMKAGVQAYINTIKSTDRIQSAQLEQAEAELTKLEIQDAQLQQIVADAKSKMKEVIKAAGGDTSTGFESYIPAGAPGSSASRVPGSQGYKKPGGISGLNDLEFNFGAGTAPPEQPKVPSGSTDPGSTNGTEVDKPDSGGSGGSGGSGSGGSEEKEVEDLEWEEDIYHDINIQLEQKSQLLNRLKKEQDKLYGKELLDNLAKQKKALEEQQALLEQKLKMQEQDLANQKKALASQGVTFNVDGTIANYNKLLNQKLAYVNSLSGEAKEAAKEEFSSLVEMMEAYEDMMMNSMESTRNEIQDSIDAQREIFLQEFEYAIQLKIEISGDLKEALDFAKDMNDEFGDMSENYERTKEQIAEQLDLVERLGLKLNEINNNPDLTEKERLEMLEKYNDELKNAVKDLKSLDEELTKIFENTLKDGLDIVKDHLDEFKNLNDQLKHYEQTLKLIGEGDNYAVLDSIYESQYENLMGQIGVLNAQMTSLQAQKNALEAAGMNGTEEWEAVDNAIKETQKSLNSLAQESLKLLQTEFKNSVNEIMATLEDAMTQGAGFDKLKQQQKDIQDDRKKYLDGEEKLLAVSKLQQKVQKEMDETSDPAKKAQLQKFMDAELTKLKDKDKLTQYDVDRANQIYDLTLKQMALEDQRATKNIMRLVRDTQGNWVYEFTEDADAIAKAQEDVSSSLEKLMELDKKKLEETQDLMLNLQEEYYKEVQKIANDAANGKYQTEEELRQALQEASDRYNEKMVVANAEYEEIKQNATISSMAVVVDTFMKTGNVLGDLTDDQEQLLTDLATKTDGTYTDMADVITGLISNDPDSIKAAMEKLGYTTEEQMNKAQESVSGLIDGMHENWNLDISDMISGMVGQGGLEESTNTAIESTMSKWDEYKNKVGQVQSETGTDLDSIKDKIGEVGTATDSLNSKTDSLIKKFKEEMDAVTKLATAYQNNRKEIQSNITELLKYIDTINKAIDAIKRKNDTESEANKNPSTDTGSTGSGSSGTTTTTPTPTPTPATAPTKGSKVRVKSNRTWYYDSEGKAPTGQTNNYADKDLYVVNTSKNKYEYAVGSTSNINSALGWLKKEDLVGFDTGGYTGEWGNSGKVAMLHEKEIVLNREDTSKILDAVKLVRGLSGNAIDGIANAIADTSRKTIEALGTIVQAISPNNTPIQQSQIQQTVEINADFSGVKNSNEIEKAFENMANMASQYVSRR